MESTLSLRGDPPQRETVTFSHVERPHDDELTLFLVTLSSEGLEATCSVESLGGDEGFNMDAGKRVGDVEHMVAIGLGAFLQALGEGGTWEGPRTWGTLAGELVVAATTDSTGHVSLSFKVAPLPWTYTWSTRLAIKYDLGSLARLGREIKEWFKTQVA